MSETAKAILEYIFVFGFGSLTGLCIAYGILKMILLIRKMR